MTALDDRPTTTPWGLTAEQVELLLRMIAEGRVRQQKGNDHLEAWDIRRWLNRIFGFTGWSEECLDEVLVHERIWPAKEEGKFRCTAVYRVRLRLHIRDVWGNELKFSDGGAVGESVNQPSIGDAHDMALKTAYSQALKRCAIDLGDQFGLSLYDKNRRRHNQAAVQQTLGHPFAPKASDWNAEVPEDAPVTSGELDEQPEVAPEPAVLPQSNGVQRSRPAEPSPRAEQAPVNSTKGQHIAISKLFAEKFGITSAQRDRKLAGVKHYLGVDVSSTTKLSYAQAAKLIEILGPLPPHQPAPAPVPLKYQQTEDEATIAAAQALLPLVEADQAEALEQRFRDLIESSYDPASLDDALDRAHGAVSDGTLTMDRLKRLMAAGEVKRRDLDAQAKRAQQTVAVA